MPSDISSLPPVRRLLTPRRVLGLVVLMGYCLLALFPLVKRRLGIFDGGMWFLDSYAILAAGDAVQANLDPFAANPLDILQRQHSYSSWWFAVGRTGLTRQDNFLFGGSWVAAFGLAALAWLRPRTYREALLGAAILLSPPVVLAVNRANNDLVVFALLAAGLWWLREAKAWHLALFILALVLATGLKFYPFIAGVALLAVRPPARGIGAAALGLLCGGLVFASVWTDFRRAAFPVPAQLYTFGAPIVFRDLGWTGPQALLAGAGVLALAAIVCVWRGWSVPLDDPRGDLRSRLAFAAGAALLVGCFLAGISHAYRLIYVIFLLPLLARMDSGPVRSITVGLLFALLWLDGLYCLGVNLLIGPMPLAELIRRQLVWRLATQPVIWAAMALLAGALLNLLLSACRDARRTEGNG